MRMRVIEVEHFFRWLRGTFFPSAFDAFLYRKECKRVQCVCLCVCACVCTGEVNRLSVVMSLTDLHVIKGLQPFKRGKNYW